MDPQVKSEDPEKALAGQHARSEEKQRKKDEKVALRKAERDATEAPPDDKQS